MRDWLFSATAAVVIVASVAASQGVAITVCGLVASVSGLLLEVYWPWGWLGKKKAIVIKSNKTD